MRLRGRHVLAAVLAASTGEAQFVRFAYVSNAGSNHVSAFVVDGASGAWTPVPGSPYSTGEFPNRATVDSTGQFLYVTNAGSGTVSGFRINETNGSLAPLPGSPFAASSGTTSSSSRPAVPSAISSPPCSGRNSSGATGSTPTDP